MVCACTKYTEAHEFTYYCIYNTHFSGDLKTVAGGSSGNGKMAISTG